MITEHKSAVNVFVTFDVFVIFTLFGVRRTCTGSFNSKGRVTCPTHCKFCNSSDHCFLCDNGYSGKTCQHHCYICKPGTRCDKESGFCTEGCKDGLSGQYCNKTCDSRCKTCYRNDRTECLIYRNNQTSQHHCYICKPGTRCDKESGFCTEGCTDGRSGQYCNKTCDSRCKRCYRNDTTKCEPVCPDGCILQECKGNNCSKGCLKGHWGETCGHRCPEHCNIDLRVTEMSSTDTLMVVVPTLTAVLLILLAGVLFILCWKRRQSRSRNDSLLVLYRPQHTMGRHMENQGHYAPEQNANYSYALLDGGYLTPC